MAKTRIKTTPTRMQKEALIASAAVTTTNAATNVAEHVIKKRLSTFNHHSLLAKEAIPIHSTIIVQPPKRTNSISSATSTISHTSDGHSSIESPPPLPISSSSTPTNSNGPTMAELTENAIKTLNAGLLAKSNALALKNRKVYMITEKCGDASAGGHSNVGGGGNAAGTPGVGGGQKRKMYLIMEEKESDLNESQAEKFMKSECSNGAKKLTLFTDTANGQLPQKIEKILPEILNCIQAKDGRTGATVTASGSALALTGVGAANNGHGSAKTRFVSQEINGKPPTSDIDTSKIRLKMDTDKNERLPLTLPPKKNRTKIITTQIIPVTPSYPAQTTTILQQTSNGETAIGERVISSVLETNHFNGCRKTEKSGATPVIVNATTLLANGHGSSKENGSNTSSYTATQQQLQEQQQQQQQQQHKNINLSTDFLFLMKMLPKLESIAESHKSYVKTCIEDLINQYSSNQYEDQ